MKALTVQQPYAQLLAWGEKWFETRTWRTKYRGPVAIHAGRNGDKVQRCYDNLVDIKRKNLHAKNLIASLRAQLAAAKPPAAINPMDGD
jgi:hypothetical protein